jgi:diadenosine tetraphosphate (Ap4A) HIT family hydrolase
VNVDCPFCAVSKERILFEDQECIAFWDNFPISKGHVLVIPRLHVESIFKMDPETWTAIWQMVARVRTSVAGTFQADGINIGVNDGQAAGQTIKHAHIHVIPRFAGDVADPRGGVRWIIPDKAKYW